ncbi:MAG TPA: DUF397 domain-containing protein [Pseudonocardiaceae bacterium]|jgi:hypothetical protein|nr:DUF397 domain-containing protein [Pseudonocardiaceae bacterium]
MTTKTTGWRKSTYSGANNDCVEIAGTRDRIRDSKNPAGPVLRVDLDSLLAAIKIDDIGN